MKPIIKLQPSRKYKIYWYSGLLLSILFYFVCIFWILYITSSILGIFLAGLCGFVHIYNFYDLCKKRKKLFQQLREHEEIMLETANQLWWLELEEQLLQKENRKLYLGFDPGDE